MATLVTFRIGGWSAQAALDELGARTFAIARTIVAARRDPDQRRLLHLGRRGRARRRGGRAPRRAHPETLPPRRTLTILGRGVTDRRHPDAPPPRRSWLEIRWRQFRRAPRPVVRAVAAQPQRRRVLGLLYLAYDVALSRGASCPAATCASSPSPSTSSSSWWSAASRHVPDRAAADGLGDGRPAQCLERGPRVLRRRPDRLPRPGRGGPGPSSPHRMTVPTGSC